jgi:hypothetical protein
LLQLTRHSLLAAGDETEREREREKRKEEEKEEGKRSV